MSVLGVLVAAAFIVASIAHLVMVFGLASQTLPRALVSLIVPPLAPYWGWQYGMRRRVATWWIAVVLYAVLVAIATR